MKASQLFLQKWVRFIHLSSYLGGEQDGHRDHFLIQKEPAFSQVSSLWAFAFQDESNLCGFDYLSAQFSWDHWSWKGNVPFHCLEDGTRPVLNTASYLSRETRLSLYLFWLPKSHPPFTQLDSQAPALSKGTAFTTAGVLRQKEESNDWANKRNKASLSTKCQAKGISSHNTKMPDNSLVLHNYNIHFAEWCLWESVKSNWNLNVYAWATSLHTQQLQLPLQQWRFPVPPLCPAARLKLFTSLNPLPPPKPTTFPSPPHSFSLPPAQASCSVLRGAKTCTAGPSPYGYSCQLASGTCYNHTSIWGQTRGKNINGGRADPNPLTLGFQLCWHVEQDLPAQAIGETEMEAFHIQMSMLLGGKWKISIGTVIQESPLLPTRAALQAHIQSVQSMPPNQSTRPLKEFPANPGSNFAERRINMQATEKLTRKLSVSKYLPPGA